MNLKPNLWTLLFFIAAGALYFSISNQENYTKTQLVNHVHPDNDDIIYPKYPRAKFDSVRHRYLKRYVNRVDTMEALKEAVGVANLGIKGYQFAHDQFKTMFQEYDSMTHPDVYIYPVIIPGATRSALDTLDLFFLVKERGEKELSTDTFYDFTRPCPPTCDSTEIPYVNFAD